MGEASPDPHTPILRGDTAERILLAAAELFASNGFGATSTRDIASAVGIRQPGLYKHFSSKDDILRALFDRATGRPTSVATALVTQGHSGAVALYRFLYETCVHLHHSPLVLASLLQTPELSRPEFAAEQQANERANLLVRNLVQQGIDGGDFRALDASATPRLLLGLVDSLATPTLPSPTDEDVAELVTFAFCGLLRNRRRLPSIREAAMAIDLRALRE